MSCSGASPPSRAEVVNDAINHRLITYKVRRCDFDDLADKVD
ncbi:hypothetical protein HNQ92_001040 [Rhabdobacter roseus]|uniref:Uncharacterized protein n=1 Tax=Rhabdobacter roseus TaxID=1655419 RepID=A0A840THH3_9BACT|nr:hypothetical protein [Rhabdobacter roseus]MBB5282914.1 hypothetical protein [Rhabdobacter roseus]